MRIGGLDSIRLQGMVLLSDSGYLIECVSESVSGMELVCVRE